MSNLDSRACWNALAVLKGDFLKLILAILMAILFALSSYLLSSLERYQRLSVALWLDLNFALSFVVRLL